MDTLDILFRRRLFRVSTRAYHLLLVAYPAGFRGIYGRHMAQVFQDCCRDAYQQGGSGRVIILWIAALYDLGTNALGERISTLVHEIEEKNVMHALLSSKQEQAKFMISSQQFPVASMFRLLDYPCAVPHTGKPLAL
ncbi:MAG: hypothetical protein ABI406_20280 [Ktedonobacteraceae bacterium]